MSGPAGSGRSTAIRALEDLGFEAIDNLPLSFLPRLFPAPVARPVVIGIDPRNREFATDRLIAAVAEVERSVGHAPVLVYLDCDVQTIVQRYSETRRRHPLSPNETPNVGIEREIALLAPLRERADVLIDTRHMTPHDLRAEMSRQFGDDSSKGSLAVSIQSFSYKRGLPRGADMVIDVRFLKNPHWSPPCAPAMAATGTSRCLSRLTRIMPDFTLVSSNCLPSCCLPTGERARVISASESAAQVVGIGRWQ